jgi:hypothetical protein
MSARCFGVCIPERVRRALYEAAVEQTYRLGRMVHEYGDRGIPSVTWRTSGAGSGNLLSRPRRPRPGRHGRGNSRKDGTWLRPGGAGLAELASPVCPAGLWVLPAVRERAGVGGVGARYRDDGAQFLRQACDTQTPSVAVRCISAASRLTASSRAGNLAPRH